MNFNVFVWPCHYKRRFLLLAAFPVIFSLFDNAPIHVAKAAHGFDGSHLGLLWIVPFVSITLSITFFFCFSPVSGTAITARSYRSEP